MNMPRNKRPRSENWLVEDKHLLIELVKERVDAIENKNTDTTTNTKKKEAWTDLCNRFNSMSNGATRTPAQLKAQWGMIKLAKKKEKAFQKGQLLTGGSPPPPPVTDAHDDDITSWLPHEFKIETNVISNYKSDKPPARRKLLNTPVNKKEPESKTYSTASLAKTEVECRKELHSIQMENEKKKESNLDLKRVLILKKIEYYEKLISSCPSRKQEP